MTKNKYITATFAYNALKIDAYTHIWPMFHFSPLKLQKPYSFLKLLDVKKDATLT